jgi:hypothetical protein
MRRTVKRTLTDVKAFLQDLKIDCCRNKIIRTRHAQQIEKRKKLLLLMAIIGGTVALFAGLMIVFYLLIR